MNCPRCHKHGTVWKRGKQLSGRVFLYLRCERGTCTYRYIGIDGVERKGTTTWRHTP